MKNRYSVLLLGSSLLGLAAAPLAASAQTATPPNAGQGAATSLQEVVVTAEKRTEQLKNVPMSVSALPGAALEKLHVMDFGDLAAFVPGLSLVSSDPGVTRLTLRGQNAGGDGSTVAVYVDESPFGSSNALLNGAILTSDFDTWDLARTEVLRGPQGTLYGANSEGGLIKFVTNPPVLGNYSAAIEATGESMAHGQLGGDIRGMANLAWGDIVALRVDAFNQAIPGYVDDPLSGQRYVNQGQRYGGRASLLFKPTDNFSIRLTALGQWLNTNGSSQVDIDPVTLQPVHGDLTQERYYPEPSTFRYENYNGTINWDLGPVNLVSTTSYGVMDTARQVDGTSATYVPASLVDGVYSPPVSLGGLLSGIFGEQLGAYENNNAYLKKFTQEIRLSSPASDRWEWQLGAYYTHEDGDLAQALNAFLIPGGASAGLPALEIVSLTSTYQEWAGFGDLTYHFNSSFDLQIGGRYSANKQSGTESLAGLLVATTNFTTPSSGHVFTWSVAPRWHVNANTLVYARVATGFRPGGPNVLPPGTPASVPREYGADNTINYEIGVRSTQFEGRLSIDVAAFYVDWNNIQLLEYVDNTGVDANGGKARSDGVEWTFGLAPVRGLRFNWTGAYTDAVLTSPASAVNAYPGDPLPYAPKWSTSLDGEYDWPMFGNYNGFVGATWSYVGSRSTDFASGPTSPEFPDQPEAAGQVVLPSYNTFAVRLGLENDRYSVQLWGKNLGDTRGINSYESSGAPGFAGEAAYIEPRTFGITLAAKFN
ncbi:MAG: TonB-dependent receptor [Caulobacteraceae bacterium]